MDVCMSPFAWFWTYDRLWTANIREGKLCGYGKKLNDSRKGVGRFLFETQRMSIIMTSR